MARVWTAPQCYDHSEMPAGASQKQILLLLALVVFGALSCSPPTSIAAFAGDADQAITAGAPIFADIYDSCVRRRADEESITPRFPSAGEKSGDATMESACGPFAPEVKELESVSTVMSAYFRAMHDLAAFDEATPSGEAEQAGQHFGTAAVLSATQVDSIAKLSGLITRAVTGHYQRSKLGELLRAADPHIAVVSQALETILTKDYGSLLDEEKRALRRRYLEVSGTKEQAVILLLNRAYSEDLNELQRRRGAAKAYVETLKQAREGHHQLASAAGQLNGKETALALQPYISRLETLMPAVERLVLKGN